MRPTPQFIFTVLFLCLLVFGANLAKAEEPIEFRLNIGLFTDHYLGDSDELNENNHLLQLTAAKDGKLITFASFLNSHFKESYLLGYGHEKQFTPNFRGGAYLAIVKGYGGEIKTHYEGYLFAPTLFFNYYGVSLNVIPAAYVVGYEITF